MIVAPAGKIPERAFLVPEGSMSIRTIRIGTTEIEMWGSGVTLSRFARKAGVSLIEVAERIGR